MNSPQRRFALHLARPWPLVNKNTPINHYVEVLVYLMHRIRHGCLKSITRSETMKAKNRDPIRTSVFAVSALVLVIAASFAQAGPLVTDWGYSTSVTFSGATWKQGTGNPPYGDGTTTATASELSWGATGANFQNPNSDPDNATNRSALTAGNVATGALTGGCQQRRHNWGGRSRSVTTPMSAVTRSAWEPRLRTGTIRSGIPTIRWRVRRSPTPSACFRL